MLPLPVRLGVLYDIKGQVTMRISRLRLAGLATLVVLTGGLCAVTALASAGPCPNEVPRAEARSTQLPQCRAYELVSPVYTADSGVGEFLGAAPDGEAAEFGSAGGFAGPGSSYGFNWYIGRRSHEGWETSWIGVPATLGGTTVGTTTSFDLAKQLIRVQFLTGEQAGSTGLFLSEDLAAAPALSFEGVPEYENIPHEGTRRGVEAPSDESPDFSHVVIHGNADSGGEYVLYELVGVGGPAPVLSTVSVDPEGKTIDGVVGSGEGRGGSMFHAISTDGSEVFFTNDASGLSYVRVKGETTLELGGLFQGASEDGSKVFLRGTGFTLYMDEIDSEPGHEPATKTVPISGEAVGLYVRSSDDGSHVYFISDGVLAENKNENKEEAEAGKWNLYVYDTVTEKTAFIAQGEPGGSLSGILDGVHVEAQVNGCPHASANPKNWVAKRAASSCSPPPRTLRPVTRAALRRCSSTTRVPADWPASRSAKTATRTTATTMRRARA